MKRLLRRRFLELAVAHQAILAALEEADHATRGTGELRGTLRVATSPSFAIRTIMPALDRFVDQHPGQRFVVDHVAKPRIRDGAIEPWATLMRDLARRPNVWCKLSGLATEADHAKWTPAHLRPYLEHALACFGPDRLIYGGGFDEKATAESYRRERERLASLLNFLAPEARAKVLGGNAAKLFGFTSG